MATALQGFRLTARCCSCRTIAHRYAAQSIEKRRAFSTTPLRSKNEGPRADALKRAEKALGGESLREFESELITPEDWDELDHAQTLELTDRIRSRYPAPQLPQQRKKLKQTFMNQGDPEPWEVEDPEEDDHDDLSTLAHGELEQHREMRHYARLAAWEMPLLSSMLSRICSQSSQV
jgi:small subunit ribosomal protein S35